MLLPVLCRPDSRNTFDEESLPTIRETGPASLTPPEGVLLGDSCRSEASLLNGDSSIHSNASMESNPLLRSLGGDSTDKFVPLVELRDILRQLNFTRWSAQAPTIWPGRRQYEDQLCAWLNKFRWPSVNTTMSYMHVCMLPVSVGSCCLVCA